MKNPSFSICLSLCFYSLEQLFLLSRKAFFFLEYREKYFPCLFCLKAKTGKFYIFDQVHGLTLLKKIPMAYFKKRKIFIFSIFLLNRLKKSQFFKFLKNFFYSLNKVFFSRISSNTISWPIWLKRKRW